MRKQAEDPGRRSLERIAEIRLKNMNSEFHKKWGYYPFSMTFHWKDFNYIYEGYDIKERLNQKKD